MVGSSSSTKVTDLVSLLLWMVEGVSGVESRLEELKLLLNCSLSLLLEDLSGTRLDL